MKTADAAQVNAGDQIGFTLEVKNTGTGDAKGVLLSDALPAGSGAGVTWAVDGSVGTRGEVVLAGAKGGQTLSLASNTLPAAVPTTPSTSRATTSFARVRGVRQHGDVTTTNANDLGSVERRRRVSPANVDRREDGGCGAGERGRQIGFTLTGHNTGRVTRRA